MESEENCFENEYLNQKNYMKSLVEIKPEIKTPICNNFPEDPKIQANLGFKLLDTLREDLTPEKKAIEKWNLEYKEDENFETKISKFKQKEKNKDFLAEGKKTVTTNDLLAQNDKISDYMMLEENSESLTKKESHTQDILMQVEYQKSSSSSSKKRRLKVFNTPKKQWPLSLDTAQQDKYDKSSMTEDLPAPESKNLANSQDYLSALKKVFPMMNEKALDDLTDQYKDKTGKIDSENLLEYICLEFISFKLKHKKKKI